MTKKRKCGYDYLKEKSAKLENELAREIEKNQRFADAATKAQEFFGERYVWLYEHAPFWVKWQFKKTFKGTIK